MLNNDLQWNNLLQKLTTTPTVSDQGPRSAEGGSHLGKSQQNPHVVRSNGDSPAVKSPKNELNEREEFSIFNRENIAAAFNFSDDVLDLQINDAKSVKHEERSGRTLALNSRFICYSDENEGLVIKSLKNLSLVHKVQDLDSRVVDLAFLDDALSNYLAIISAKGTLAVYVIDLNHAKDQIVIYCPLSHHFERSFEKAQLQWKDKKKLGVVNDTELTIFDLPVEESGGDSNKLVSTIFETSIRDFTFSPAYPLIYLLLDNNTVRVINIENNSKVRDFVPHDESAGPVLRVLSYKSLVRHEPKPDANGPEKTYDSTWRDIFLTITQGFEIKVWDLSEWDAEKEQYFCIETFQLNQVNDKIDPISLIKRFTFYDPGLNFLFIGFKLSGDKGINVNAFHIDQYYCGYSDTYDTVKKTRKFFNSNLGVWFKKNDFTDISVLILGDDEIEYYFNKNSYVQMTDFEPASTRTQDGSYACNSKSILCFFVHIDNVITVYKVIGDKLYPFAFVEEFDKLTQADQLENQSNKGDNTDNFPPDFPPFLKSFITQNKKPETSLSDSGRLETKDFTKKSEPSGFKDDIQESTKANLKDITSKEDTASPDVVKVQPHKKKHDRKEREAAASESHEHSKQHKNAPTKVVTRGDKNANPPVQNTNLKSVESLEKELQQAIKRDDNQAQAIEKAIEKKFQDLTDKSLQLLTNKFGKLEEIIESKVNERVSKLQMDSLSNALSKDLDEKMQREFANAFEKTVTPCFEKYLVKMFEQVCTSFEKGHKFYIDKLNIENAKSAQLKETMNEVIKSFVQISNALTEGLVNNQSNFNRMEHNAQDKQNQISRLLDQLGEILTRQQDIQRKVDVIEKDMQDISNQYQNELETFRSIANKYLERFNEFSSQPYLPGQGNTTIGKEETKREANPYGMYPPQTGYYNKNSKEKSQTDQFAYLQAIMAGRPMDVSGNMMPRGMPGMSPGSSQMMNPYQQQQPPVDYYNPYQKQKNPQAHLAYNPNFPYPPPPQQGNVNQPQNPQNQILPFNNPAQQGQQQTMENSPEYQALRQKIEQLDQLLKLQQQTKEKEEDKGGNFVRSESSPYIMNQDNSKNFFDPNQTTQPQSSSNQQTPSSHPRTLSEANTQMKLPVLSQTPSLGPPHEQEPIGSKPPGINLPNQPQPQPQPQPNFVQALLQNFPQNIQQSYTQNQPINPQKMNSNFVQNIQGQGQGAGIEQSPQQNTNPMTPQNTANLAAPVFFPQGGFIPQNMNQNYSNFGYYNVSPQQMNNPTINKPSTSKTTSSVGLDQIPMYNSMYKTPSRDALEENSNASGTGNNTTQ